MSSLRALTLPILLLAAGVVFGTLAVDVDAACEHRQAQTQAAPHVDCGPTTCFCNPGEPPQVPPSVPCCAACTYTPPVTSCVSAGEADTKCKATLDYAGTFDTVCSGTTKCVNGELSPIGAPVTVYTTENC